MKFGEAITLLNAGHPITRPGWNGKGMFLVRAGGYKVPVEDIRQNSFINAEFLKRRGLTHMEILPHIDMWTINAEGRQAYLPGWLASQSDMLADDWMIYTEPTGEPTTVGAGTVSKPKNPKKHWTQTPEGKLKMAARRRRGSKK